MTFTQLELVHAHELHPRPGPTSRGVLWASACLHETNGLAAAHNAITAGGLRLIKPLVGNPEKRVVIGRVPRATGDTYAHGHARVFLTSGRARDTPPHPLTECQRVLGIDAVGNDDKFFASK